MFKKSKSSEKRSIEVGRKGRSNSPKVITGLKMCLKHRFYFIPQPQISGTKDTGAETRRAIKTRAAHRRNAVNKLGLTHRAHFGGAIRSIESTALGKDRLNNIMTAVSDVATNLLAKIHFLTKSHSSIAT